MNAGRFYKRAVRVGDTVNAAVAMITEGITGAVLHVADEDVVPIRDIQGAIGGKFEIRGAVVTVFGNDEILAVLGGVARILIHDLVLFGAKEADGIVEKNVALHIVWEVTAGDKLKSRGGTDEVFFFNKVWRFRCKLTVGDIDVARCHPEQAGV